MIEELERRIERDKAALDRASRGGRSYDVDDQGVHTDVTEQRIADLDERIKESEQTLAAVMELLVNRLDEKPPTAG